MKKKKALEQCKWIALCTRPQNFKKQPGAASPNSRAKRELTWTPPKLNSVFDITKHHVCCGCFKRRSNHANKRPLIHYPLFIGPDKSDLAQNDGVGFGFGPIHFFLKKFISKKIYDFPPYFSMKFCLIFVCIFIP